MISPSFIVVSQNGQRITLGTRDFFAARFREKSGPAFLVAKKLETYEASNKN